MTSAIKNKSIALGLDHGTSSVKAMLLSDTLEIIKEFEPLEIKTLQSGRDIFEQNPLQHLLHAKKFIAAAKDFLENHNLTLSTIGLSVQRSGATAWDKTTGAVIHPLIIWKDTRTSSTINALLTEQMQYVSQATSLPVLPYYAAGKIGLLQSMFPSPDVLVGTLDTFLIHQLCTERPFLTEPSMAARTMLFNLQTNSWDKKLTEIFRVEQQRLASIAPSIGKLGSINGTSLAASLGDQQAALFAYQEDFSQPVLNLGTIASLIIPTGNSAKLLPGYITSILFSDKDTTNYILEGISHASGEVIDYIERELGIDKRAIDAACLEAKNSDFSWFWSAGGYATPLWKTEPLSCRSELSASNNQIAKALVENIGGFLVEIIDELIAKNILIRDKDILCTGGLSELNFLLQYLAELSNTSFSRVETKNAGAFGAAKAALKGIGAGSTRLAKITAHFDAKRDPSAQAIDGFFRWKKLRDEALAK